MYKRRGETKSTIDLLFTMVLVFLVITALLLMMPKKPSEAIGAIDSKAEYIIFVDWDSEINTDVDVWVRTPTNETVFFKRKRGEGLVLERDDQGHVTDRVGGSTININQEIVTIRGTHPGTYTINGHIYYSHTPLNNLEVSIRVIKLNPFHIVYQGKRIFNRIDEEQTFLSMTINEQGYVQSKMFDPIGIVDDALKQNNGGVGR
jgi:hypothetical protein